MPDILDIHEFFVEGGDQESSHVLLHITEPSTPEEQAKGYFFALCELNGADGVQIERFQRAIDQLETLYYGSKDTAEKNAFERALEVVNRRGHHVLSDSDAETHCVVGVISGHELSVSYHGAPDIRVIYTRKDGPSSMSLVEKRADNSQLFSSLLNGAVQSGDRIYVATPHVSEYLTPDRVEKIVGSRPPAEACAHLQKVLSDLNNGFSFGGIIFHISSEAPRTGRRPKYLEDKADESNETPAPKSEKEPSLLERASNRMAAYRDMPKEKSRLLSAAEGMLIVIGKTLVISLKGISKFALRLFVVTGKSVVGLFLIITNKAGQRAQVLDQLKTAIQKKYRGLMELPLITKIIFFFMLASGIIFAGSIALIRYKNELAESRKAYAAMVQAIADKKTAADAALIYGDADKSRTLLGEAQTLISSLPKRTESENQTAVRWQEEIKKSFTSLRHVRVARTELIVDLSKNYSGANASKLASLSGALMAYGPDDIGLYAVDPVTKQVERKNHDTMPRLLSANTPKEQDGILFLRPENAIAIYDKNTGQLTAREMPAPKKESVIAAGVVYNQRLYTLDPATNQIYRHSRTQTGYDKGTPWIKPGSVDFSTANALAIDGDMFVLTANNILKFANNQPADFNLQGIDPPLDRPAAIWTYTDVNYIYVLEPANKRLLVIDKNGKLKDQYTSEEWQKPTDMVVDEAKKTAYVIDENKIYRFKLE